MEKRAIVITGPTGSGKTKLSILLGELIDGEIISADSRQIYRFLDIGTAKPDKSELSRIPHHFIDMLNPDQNYNVSRYEHDALEKLKILHEKGKIPIVAGGSGLYIKALVDGLFDEVDTDPDFRNEMLQLRRERGSEALYEKLKETDPVSAEKMLPQNWKRIIRALEVYHLSGRPIWEHHESHKSKRTIEFEQYCLDLDRAHLYELIEVRVDKMITSGLVGEVESILKMGYSEEMNSLNTVGYKEIISYLKNEISLERAIELIKRNTRRYAKRQLTWIRGDKRVNWIKINRDTSYEMIADQIAQGKFR